MISGGMAEDEEEVGMRPRAAAMRRQQQRQQQQQQQQPIAAAFAGVADRLFPRLSSSSNNSMAIPVQVRVRV